MTAMLTIGNVTLDAPFFQAGLAGYSDAAMRLVARRHGAPYCVTEAMLDQFLIAGGKGLAAAELDDADHPIAGQLMGSHPADIAAGAKILVGLGYDVIDVNLACPVKKVRKKARGGHLLSVPDEAVAILDAVRQAVPAEVPCTVKLRRAYDDTAEAERAFHSIFEKVIEFGYAAAVVHCRTVEQKYLGPGHWPFLRNLVQTYSTPPRSAAAPTPAHAPRLLIGGSGDVWSARDIFRMINDTGVDLVSVARGCIGNPWVFREARTLMQDPAAQPPPPTIFEQRDVLIEHFHLSVRLHGEATASRMMRKFGIRFSRHHPDGETVKGAFIRVQSLADWHAVLAAHYTADGPGVANLPAEALADPADACPEPVAA
jgi:tRNA-dihydrouridine synthase B